MPDETFDALVKASNLAVDLRVSLCKASYHLRVDPDGVRDYISKLEQAVKGVSMALDDILSLEVDE